MVDFDWRHRREATRPILALTAATSFEGQAGGRRPAPAPPLQADQHQCQHECRELGAKQHDDTQRRHPSPAAVGTAQVRMEMDGDEQEERRLRVVADQPVGLHQGGDQQHPEDERV